MYFIANILNSTTSGQKAPTMFSLTTYGDHSPLFKPYIPYITEHKRSSPRTTLLLAMPRASFELCSRSHRSATVHGCMTF